MSTGQGTIAEVGSIPRMQTNKAAIRTVAFASLVGTTIEWYDFFIFSSLTGIIFNRLFFPAADPFVSTMLAYATFAIGFVVRPLGGAAWGHFGDKVGRRPVLIFALMLMGVATFMIGLLPTYAQAGILAPIALLSLRILQGLALGGEWGGAVLMAYEHADEDSRIRYSSFPQIGLALGLCLSTAMIALLSNLLSNSAFTEWGWRIPFLLSIVLLAVGVFIRLKVLETPQFLELKSNDKVAASPVIELLRKYPGTVLLSWTANLIMGVVFAVYAVYAIPLLTQAGYSRGTVLWWISISGLILIFTIPFAASLAGRYGLRRVYFWSALVNAAVAFPALWLMRNSGNPVLVALTVIVPVGILWAPLYGPLAAIYCELFEARLRYTGISVAYQIGAVLSVSLTPLIATTLAAYSGGGIELIAAYMVATGLISALSVALMKTRHK